MKKYYFILFVLIFSSCRTVLFYSNDPVITAEVDEKSDINIAAGVNLSEYNTGFHANSTYGLTDNVFLLGSFTVFKKSENGFSSNDNDYFSGYNYNLGAGVYKPLDNGMVLELGLGYQGGINDNRSTGVFTNIKRQKLYCQPSISYMSSILHLGFGLRVGLLDVIYIKSNDPSFPGNTSSFSGKLLVEPGINLAIGKILKYGFQLSYSFHEFTDLVPFGYIFGGYTTDNLSLSFFLKFNIDWSEKIE